MNRNHYNFVFDHCRINKMCGICAVFNLNGSNNGGGMSMKVSVLLSLLLLSRHTLLKINLNLIQFDMNIGMEKATSETFKSDRLSTNISARI